MISKILSNVLRKLADDLDGGNCNMSEEEMLSIFEHVSYINNSNAHMSKEQACAYLNISRATFDRLVADGKLPKGQKRVGFKELSWRRRELKVV